MSSPTKKVTSNSKSHNSKVGPSYLLSLFLSLLLALAAFLLVLYVVKQTPRQPQQEHVAEMSVRQRGGTMGRRCTPLPDNRHSEAKVEDGVPLSPMTPLPLDEPGNCLLSSSEACDTSRDCAAAAYADECLLSRIPPSTTPSHVACCFRCCVAHFLDTYYRHWGSSNTTTHPSAPEGLHNRSLVLFPSISSSYLPASDAAVYPLAGASAYAALSSSVLAHSHLLGSQQHTMTRLCTIFPPEPPAAPLTLQHITAATSRNVGVINYASTCAPPAAWLLALRQQVLFGQPRIVRLHTTQPLCTGTPRDRHTAQLAYRYLPGKVSLLPMGARDVALLLSVAAAAASTLWARRPLQLSCACLHHAQHHHAGDKEASIRLEQTLSTLQGQGFPDCAPRGNSSPLSLAQVYASLASARFVVSPSHSSQLSACEWEALALGAVPVVLQPPHAMATVHTHAGRAHTAWAHHLADVDPLLDQLYEGTPTLRLASSSQLTASLLASLSSPPPNASVSKAYLPHWIYHLSSHVVAGAHVRRSLVPSLLRMRKFLADTRSTCATVKHAASNADLESLRSVPPSARASFTRRHKDSQGSEGGKGSTSPVALQTAQQRKQQQEQHEARHQAKSIATRQAHSLAEDRDHMLDESEEAEHGRARRRLGQARQAGKSRGASGRSELPKRVHHGDAGGGDRGDGGGIGGEDLSYERLDVNGSLSRPLFDLRALQLQRRAEAQTSSTLAAASEGVKEAASADASPTLSCRLSNTTVDVVVPRCCERSHELAWLPQLLLLSPQIKAFVYYKCPRCLPRSKLGAWLAPNASAPPLGWHILDDSPLLAPALAGRVLQLPAFDGAVNTKEAGAYLTHMTTFYASLGEQTLYLHADPASHASLGLLEKTLAHLLLCGPRPSAAPVRASPRLEKLQPSYFANQSAAVGKVASYQPDRIHFMHLAGLYLGPTWGSPPEWLPCRYALYIHLNMSSWTGSAATHIKRFGNPKGWMSTAAPRFDAPVASYKAGMFVASREAVRLRPKGFWARLLAALRGSGTGEEAELHKACPSLQHDFQRGPLIGSHIERLWHVFFGLPPVLKMRAFDASLPRALRARDCLGFGNCHGAV